METKRSSKDEKLEKELKTLVSRMKNENSALNKILVQLKSDENDQIKELGIEEESNKK